MTPTYDNGVGQLYQADARALPLDDASVDCVVTSPPYWGLRDYGTEGQLGLEPTPDEYVCNMVEVFREVRRVLKPTGTLWLNLGDSYIGNATGSLGDKITLEGGKANQASGLSRPDKRAVGLKAKDLVGIPWMVAFALRADGWYLRSDIIWAKPNPMPESTKDRPTKAHEYLFLLAKSERYYYDAEAIKERDAGGRSGNVERKYRHEHGGVADTNARQAFSVPWESDGTGRNRRSVWEIATQPYPEAHFATFPESLVEPCILAGCPPSGTVLDPFIGSGTTAAVAQRLGRRWVGCDLNEAYLRLAAKRVGAVSLPLAL